MIGGNFRCRAVLDKTFSAAFSERWSENVDERRLFRLKRVLKTDQLVGGSAREQIGQVRNGRFDLTGGDVGHVAVHFDVDCKEPI